MLSEKFQKELNDQIQRELYSSYLYLSMAAYAESINMGGAGRWLQLQAQEEVGHAMKMYAYVNDNGGRVKLQAIEEPPADFGSLLDIFKEVLDHEKKVTDFINKLYAMAKEDNDYRGEIFLQWFVTEQIEEEKTAQDIIDMLEMVGDKGQGLFMVDRQLGARTGGGSGE